MKLEFYSRLIEIIILRWFSSACREALGDNWPAVPWVCQEGGALQQLDGWSYGRSAGHVHCSQHWGDPGEQTLADKVLLVVYAVLWNFKNISVQRKYIIYFIYCSVLTFFLTLSISALRVWSQPMTSLKLLYQKPIRNGWPSWAFKMKSWRLLKHTGSSWWPRTPTLFFPLRISATNGKLWVLYNVRTD